MTRDRALELFEEVLKAAREDDDASAHVAEDKLRKEVLQAVADGSPIAGELARIALSTDALDFSRWFA